MCGRVRRPNRRQIGLICTQPSGEITNGAAEQNGGSARGYPSGFASLAVRLWRSAVARTFIFMQRRPRD